MRSCIQYVTTGTCEFSYQKEGLMIYNKNDQKFYSFLAKAKAIGIFCTMSAINTTICHAIR